MKRLFILIILIACVLPLKAENIYFQYYGINEGLSSNLVFGFAEDSNGLLWLATSQGIDKFDGRNFTHYSLPQLDKSGLVDYMRFYIKADSKGNIFVATRTGLIYKYDRLRDEFRFISEVEENTNSNLRAFYIDNDDNLIITGYNGVWRIETENFQSSKLVSSNDVFYVSQDNNGRYYWCGRKGIQVLDSDFNEQYNLYPDYSSDESNLKISIVYIDNQKQHLWGVSDDKGIFKVDLFSRKITYPKEFGIYKNIAVRSISKFSQNEIVFGIDGVGLVVWNENTQAISNEIIYQNGKKGTLSSNAIYDIYQNGDGVFFIGTYRGGINVYNPNRINFGYINSTPFNKNSLLSNVVLSVHELSPGVVAFGTYEGVSIYNKMSDTWQHLVHDDDKMSEVILSLSSDTRQNIWATSFTNSLMFFERKNTSYPRYVEFIDELPIKPSKISVDNQNKIWLIDYAGLYNYSVKENKLERFYLAKSPLSLINLPDDLLAIGTENGLLFFNKKSSVYETFDFIDKANMNIPLIKSLKVDAQNRLWAITKTAGLFVIDFSKKTVKNINIEDGLAVNHIFGIAINEDEIWVSTSKGISKINPDFSVENYSSSDGISSIDFNYDAALYDSSGTLYFGTNEGVITLRPGNKTKDVSFKNIVFSKFLLNHKRIFPGENSPLKMVPNLTKRINLKYDQNSFSMGFESVDFIEPESGIFEWKLDGFDEDWMRTDNLSNISYTNLDSGQYTFRVRALDEQGKIISNQKTLDIYIAKPWWLSGWASGVYVALCLLFILVINYLNSLRINSKTSAERLKFMINLAHEIKTPLLLIKAPLNDLMSSVKTTGVARKNINIALSSAERLHHQIIEFLDMGSLSKIENTLELKHTDFIQLIKDKITAFRVIAEKKNINLSAKFNTPEFYIKTDRRLMDKILSNLISNALKYTDEGGTVLVELQILDGYCKILVTDSGIGILRSEQKNIFKPFYRTERAKQFGATGNGMGLVVVQNLAKLIEGKLKLVESSDAGTTFEFKFPYEISYLKDLSIEEKEEDEFEDDKQPKLLLVEDDNALLNFSVDKLKKHFHVITATNGIEALEKCETLLPEIIVSDVMMPKMNGFQLCMKLKSDIKTSHIPLILFTGLDGKEEIMEGLEAGADDYIVKPFEFDILIKKIETLLNNRQILKKRFLYLTDEDEDVGFATKLDNEWIAKVNEFVEQHIEDADLSPGVLYEHFGMSRSTFYHKTKSLVDLSPLELIRTIRLKKAKTLLGTSGLDISQVAYKLGFNDPKYFSTIFKRYFGQSPSSFISSKKQTQSN